MGKGILEMPPATVTIVVNTTWSAALISRKSAPQSFPVKAAVSSPFPEEGNVTVMPSVRSMASAVRIIAVSVRKIRKELPKRNLIQNHQL